MKIPLKLALFYIVFSILIVSGTAVGGFFAFRYFIDQREQDPNFAITSIEQRSSSGQILPTAYLAQLLNLSRDRPTNLYRFNVKAAEEKLRESPLIQTASIKKIRPGSIFIEYQLRTPKAVLGDFTNTALDKNGYLIPLEPFFSPKNLPTIYLGLDQIKWGEPISGLHAELVLNLMALFSSEPLSNKTPLKQIDVTKASDLSYGQRQIIVILKGRADQILRLTPQNYKQELANYLVLHPYFKRQKKDYIIDMRIPHHAFISEAFPH
jgi:hypothetical protein